MMKLSHHFGRNLWCTFTQMLNEKKYKFLIFKVIKVGLQVKYSLANLNGQEKRYYN